MQFHVAHAKRRKVRARKTRLVLGCSHWLLEVVRVLSTNHKTEYSKSKASKNVTVDTHLQTVL